MNVTKAFSLEREEVEYVSRNRFSTHSNLWHCPHIFVFLHVHLNPPWSIEYPRGLFGVVRIKLIRVIEDYSDGLITLWYSSRELEQVCSALLYRITAQHNCVEYRSETGSFLIDDVNAHCQKQIVYLYFKDTLIHVSTSARVYYEDCIRIFWKI